MQRQAPPPLPENDRSPVFVVASVAAAIILLFITLFVVMFVPDSGGGDAGEGDSQANSSGRNSHGKAGDSKTSTSTSSGASGGTKSIESPSDLGAPSSPQTQQSVAPIVTPTTPLGESSVEADAEITSSPLPRTYEFFTQRSTVGAAPPSADDVGREADFFGVAAEGRDFVYVVDKSSSMSGERFEMARDELLRSLNKLKSNQRFFVIFYDDIAYLQPSKKLVTAKTSNVRLMSNWVKNAASQGGTAPMDAIERAIDFEPDAIFVLSDGEFDQSVVTQTARLNENSAVKIHTIGFQNDAGTLRDESEIAAPAG